VKALPGEPTPVTEAPKKVERSRQTSKDRVASRASNMI
jgi:hypothetical protein